MQEGWVSVQRLGTCLKLERPLAPAPWGGLGRALSARDPGKPQGWSVPNERGLQPTDTQPTPPHAHLLSCYAQRTPEAHPGTPSLTVPWLEEDSPWVLSPRWMLQGSQGPSSPVEPTQTILATGRSRLEAKHFQSTLVDLLPALTLAAYKAITPNKARSCRALLGTLGIYGGENWVS